MVLGRHRVIEPIVQGTVNGRIVHVPAVFNETVMMVTGIDETIAPHSSDATIEAALQALQPKVTCKVVDKDLAAVRPGVGSPYETNFSLATQAFPCQTGQQSAQITPMASQQLHVVENGVSISCQ